jgi:hypothetical protein
MNFPIYYKAPSGYTRIHAATTPNEAKVQIETLYAEGRVVCFVRVAGFRLAVYAKVL